MSIVRLYNCPYFITGACSLRPDSDLVLSGCVPKIVAPHCPKGRTYCHVDVDTDKWSKGTLELIRILVKNWRRKGNGNAGEIIDIIEQILRRRDDMKDSSSDVLCVSREWFEEKQAEARQEGREEAWDLARRIAAEDSDCYSYEEVYDLFDTRSPGRIFSMPVEEMLSKDKKYQEEKNALHIGDEVDFGVLRGYVIEILLSDDVRVLTKIYDTFTVSCKKCKKTGKHNPYIEKVIASFEEEESE